MARKLFGGDAASPISPLIDVVMNGLAAMFIILMVYIVMAPADDGGKPEPISFLDDVKLPPAILGQSYIFTLPVTGGQGKRQFEYSGELPTGLSLDDASGTVFGTPRAPLLQESKLGFSVSDPTGRDSLQTVLNSFPAIAPASAGSLRLKKEASDLPFARLGTPYEVVIGAEGGVSPYVWSVEGRLPPGLSLAGGRISGTPQDTGAFEFEVFAGYASGTFSYRASTHSWQGDRQSRKYRILVGDCKNPALYMPSGRVGERYNATVAGVCPESGDEIVWEAAVAGISPSTIGSLRGTPSTAGDFPVRYDVVNAGKKLASGRGTLRILPPRPPGTVGPLSLSAYLGEKFSQPIPYQGLEEPVSFSAPEAVSRELGFKLTGNRLEGAPAKAGTHQFAIIAKDALGKAVEGRVTLIVPTHPKPYLKLPPELNVPVSRAIWIQPLVGGEEEQYRWEARGLPEGLTLQTSGTIVGMISKPGRWKISIGVTHLITRETASSSLDLIAAYPSDSEIEIISRAVPTAIVAQPYEFAFATRGEFGEVKYSFKGKLPSGLRFTKIGIAGTPTQRSESEIEVVASDRRGKQSTAKTFRVASEVADSSVPKVMTRTLPVVYQGRDYEVILSAEGGAGGYKWQFSGALPPGLRYTQNGIQGSVVSKSEGSWRISTKVIDDRNQSAAQTYDLHLEPDPRAQSSKD